MKLKADIMLEEQSTAGKPPKTFAGQMVEIIYEKPTVVVSVDGYTSIGEHPSKVFWRGGAAVELAGITHVKLQQSDSGQVLVDGGLNTNYEAPRDVPGGVRFEVM